MPNWFSQGGEEKVALDAMKKDLEAAEKHAEEARIAHDKKVGTGAGEPQTITISIFTNPVAGQPFSGGYMGMGTPQPVGVGLAPPPQSAQPQPQVVSVPVPR